jgi:hypothetical protein
MTKNIIITIIVIGLFCFNCNKDNQNEETKQCPDREETLLLKSQTRSYYSGSEMSIVWEYNSQGWEIGYKEITINNSIIEHKNYEHDNNGNILYYEEFINETLNSTRRRTYSTDNLITSDSVFNSQGELIRYETWTYNSNLLTNYKFLIPQPDQTVHLHKEHKNFQYDKNNSLVQYDVYNSNRHDLITKLSYNEKGLLISECSDRVWDNYTHEVLYEYDNQCLLTDEKTIISGELNFHYTNYEHNSNGSYIYREAYYEGILHYTEERKFE